MGNETIVKTEMKFEDGKTRAIFQGHPDINMAGLMAVDQAADAWSPPHLLVSAVESCLFLTMASVAEKMRIKIIRYSSTAEGILFSPDGTHKEFREIVVRPRIELANESDRSKIPQLVKIAEEHCYVARSLKTPMRIELE